MRQQVVLPPHLAPGCIIPTTPHRAPSSATMVVAMRASDASTKVSLNHNDRGATATRRRILHKRPGVLVLLRCSSPRPQWSSPTPSSPFPSLLRSLLSPLSVL